MGIGKTLTMLMVIVLILLLASSSLFILQHDLATESTTSPNTTESTQIATTTSSVPVVTVTITTTPPEKTQNATTAQSTSTGSVVARTSTFTWPPRIYDTISTTTSTKPIAPPALVRSNAYFLSTTEDILNLNDSVFSILVKRLIASNVTYLYFNLPNIDIGGNVLDSYSNDTRLIQRFQQLSGNHTFEYIGWTGTQNDTLGVLGNFTYSGISSTVTSLYNSGFRGILLDLEPVPDQSTELLNMLSDFRLAILQNTQGMLLGANSMKLDPGAVSGQLWAWDTAYFSQVTSKLDFVVPMLFESGMTTQYGYESYVQTQIQLVSQYTNSTVLYAIPDWYANTTWHHPYAENLTNAVTAFRSYLGSSGVKISLPNMLGLGIYGLNKTYILGQGSPLESLETTQYDWSFFLNQWVNTTYPGEIGH